MEMEAGRKLLAGKNRLDSAWWQDEWAKGNAGAELAQQGEGRAQSQDPERKGQ